MTFSHNFLVTYTSNAAAFILQQQQVAQSVVAAQQRINATQASLASRGGAAGGLLNAAQLQAASPQVAKLVGEFGALGTKVRAIQDLGGSASAQIQRMGVIAQQVANTGGPAFANFGAQERVAAQGAIQLRGELESSTSAFQRHASRISETILLYAALAIATAGVAKAIDLSSTIDRESRRLEAVTGITATASHDFIQSIADIAIQTVTPLEGLISEADRAGAAFLDLPAGAERAAATLTLLGDAGKFTTVTQRDVGIETENLIAIMKQLDIPVEKLGDFLGKIVVAGGNSSTVIAALADALQISSRAAHAAGVDLDTLLAIESQFIIQTGRGGSEVGNIFNLLFSRISNPEVVKQVDKISGGILKMRDAAGALRDPFQILLDLNALLDAQLITTTQFSDILGKIAPPLNPAAKQDFILLAQTLREIGPAVAEIGAADVSNLDQLVDKLNAALGQQFLQFIEEVKKGFADLFQPAIVANGLALIEVLRTIRDTIGLIPAPVLLALVQFATFFAALRLGSFVVGGLVKLLGVGGMFTGLTAARTAALAAGEGFSTMGVAAGLLLTKLIPLLAIFLAIQAVGDAIKFAGEVGAQAAGLKQQIGGNVVGQDAKQLTATRARLVAEREALLNADTGILEGLASIPVEMTLSDSIDETDRLLALLKAAGPGATVTINQLGEAFVSLDQAAATSNQRQYGRGFQLAEENATAAAAAIKDLTAAQIINGEALTNTATLTDEISSSLATLLDRYRDGTITAAEYAAGQEQVSRASELAGQLVAAAGDELGQMPLLAAAAAAGNDELTAAIFDLITQAGDSLPAIDAQIQRVLALGAAAAAAAKIAAENPIIIESFIIATSDTSSGSEKSAAVHRIADARRGRSGATSAASVVAKMQAELAALFGSLTRGSSTAFGTGPAFAKGGAAAPAAPTPPAPNLVDIGDLPADKLAAAIAKAQALQHAIPGADEAAKDSVLNIIKDAEFLRQVKGLDDQLLRKAIEELTDIEKARLEEEKRKNAAEAILSNLQVNAGPLGALISAPALFGAGGSIPAGVNFDPTTGSFVVNLNIGEVNNLTPEQLAALIEQAVRNAIRNGLRMSGG